MPRTASWRLQCTRNMLVLAFNSRKLSLFLNVVSPWGRPQHITSHGTLHLVFYFAIDWNSNHVGNVLWDAITLRFPAISKSPISSESKHPPTGPFTMNARLHQTLRCTPKNCIDCFREKVPSGQPTAHIPFCKTFWIQLRQNGVHQLAPNKINLFVCNLIQARYKKNLMQWDFLPLFQVKRACAPQNSILTDFSIGRHSVVWINNKIKNFGRVDEKIKPKVFCQILVEPLSKHLYGGPSR